MEGQSGEGFVNCASQQRGESITEVKPDPTEGRIPRSRIHGYLLSFPCLKLLTTRVKAKSQSHDLKPAPQGAPPTILNNLAVGLARPRLVGSEHMQPQLGRHLIDEGPSRRDAAEQRPHLGEVDRIEGTGCCLVSLRAPAGQVQVANAQSAESLEWLLSGVSAFGEVRSKVAGQKSYLRPYPRRRLDGAVQCDCQILRSSAFPRPVPRREKRRYDFAGGVVPHSCCSLHCDSELPIVIQAGDC